MIGPHNLPRVLQSSKGGPPVKSAAILAALAALVPCAAAPAWAGVQLYEAESAVIFHGGFENSHPGFSGSGYVNLNNETGSLVEWTVSVPKAVSGTLTFRFANGSSSDRPMEIRVNGLAVDSSLSFPATGSWSTWKGQTLT